MKRPRKNWSLQIWNPDSQYETQRQTPNKFAFTSANTLSASAFTDRTNVYTALVGKVNANTNDNVTAYSLAKVPYTLGSSSDDSATNFVIGEIVHQATSAITAQVAACSIDSGSMAADNAAGTLWLYNFSAEASYDTGTKTWTAAGTAAATTLTPATTNCVVTGTAAAAYFYQGMVIVDSAGYFTSSKDRGGINRVLLTAGFSVATATVIITGDELRCGKANFLITIKS